MKASEVRVRKALDMGESYVDPAFLLVETTVQDDGGLVTTIDHVRSESEQGKHRWRVVTLGQSVPMSHLAALEWAISFAASRDVPIVYERDYSLELDYAAAPSADRGASTPSESK